MIFFFVMPSVLGGFANLRLPQLLGVPELVFPRLNAQALWVLPLAYQLVLYGVIHDDGPGAAWTAYPPLSLPGSHAGAAIDHFIVALHLAGGSSSASAANVLATAWAAKKSNSHGGNLHSPFVIGLVITSGIVIVIMPVLAGTLSCILLDRNTNAQFFDVAGGGDTVLYQHMF
jgi:cytochrome c oxidase subunit 1